MALLQGPPGTGKTRTILALLAVVLGGAGTSICADSRRVVGSYDMKLSFLFYI